MSVEIKDLVTSIRGGHCIVVLGPKFSFEPGKPALMEGLPAYIKKEGKISLKPDADGLFSFQERREKGLVHSLLESYVTENGTLTELHEQFMQIPFHTVISLSPSNLLAKAFAEKGLPHEFAYYNKDSNDNKLEEVPSQERPLIYNLFGSYRHPSSLILDQKDLLEFIFSILSGDKQLPEKLQTTIEQAQKFLFIGFEFDKWYLKVLLKLLQLQEKYSSYAAVPDASTLNGSRDFFTNHFNLVFVDHESQAFIGDLLAGFKAEDLRQLPEDDSSSFRSQVSELVRKGKLEDAIESLIDFFSQVEDEENSDAAFTLSGKYQRLSGKQSGGKITAEAAEVELTKISDAILALAAETA